MDSAIDTQNKDADQLRSCAVTAQLFRLNAIIRFSHDSAQMSLTHCYNSLTPSRLMPILVQIGCLETSKWHLMINKAELLSRGKTVASQASNDEFG